MAAYSYDANGNRTTLSYANGTSGNYAYNLANAVTSIQNKKGTTVLSGYTYTYYLDGNQKSKTDHTGKAISYSYDGMGRLKQESEANGLMLACTYDGRSNRATMTASGAEVYSTAYSYDGANRLTTESKTKGNQNEITRYYHDANGNLFSKTVNTVKPSSGSAVSLALGNGAGLVETYLYDCADRQTGSYVNGVSTSYTYRPDGLRHSKTAAGVTTTHIWDGQNMAAELSGTSLKANYLRGANLLASEDSAGARSYYLYNAHGDVVQLSNASGTVTKSYDYDAFGNQKGAADNADANPFRYCGEYHDAETGTVYLRARYYDPVVGRFTQVDPARDGTNWYVYCAGNPITFADATGRYYIIQTPNNSYSIIAETADIALINGPVSGLPLLGPALAASRTTVSAQGGKPPLGEIVSGNSYQTLGEAYFGSSLSSAGSVLNITDIINAIFTNAKLPKELGNLFAGLGMASSIVTPINVINYTNEHLDIYQNDRRAFEVMDLLSLRTTGFTSAADAERQIQNVYSFITDNNKYIEGEFRDMYYLYKSWQKDRSKPLGYDRAKQIDEFTEMYHQYVGKLS